MEYESDEEGFPVAAAPPPAVATSRCSVAAAEPALGVHQFSEEVGEATLRLQVVVLEGQLLVTVAEGSAPALGSFHVSASPATERAQPQPPPPVTTLLGPSAEESDAPALAQRLARRTGLHVFLTLALPPAEPLLQAVGEKRLMRELEALNLVKAAA
mmetsp:Transcript_18968/g.61838  ORF Transcript_18968/g.61838 Transcript_18968/m.61838 type:complete len:157 (+) Transcript_18968:270-740(+)